MMGQNRRRLTNRPRYNPRIESPDFLLTNSVSKSSADLTLLSSRTKIACHKHSSPEDHSEVTRESKSSAKPKSPKSGFSSPNTRRKNAIETYVRRYVSSAPPTYGRGKEPDETMTGPRVRIQDNVKIVFDEERVKKSLRTSPRSVSAIPIRKFSSIHHIADHKRAVCEETFRTRFTRSESCKDDEKFDAKRVLLSSAETERNLGNAEYGTSTFAEQKAPKWTDSPPYLLAKRVGPTSKHEYSFSMSLNEVLQWNSLLPSTNDNFEDELNNQSKQTKSTLDWSLGNVSSNCGNAKQKEKPMDINSEIIQSDPTERYHHGIYQQNDSPFKRS